MPAELFEGAHLLDRYGNNQHNIKSITCPPKDTLVITNVQKLADIIEPIVETNKEN